MTEIFLTVVNMSFMASWLIVVVLVCRAVFGKASKNMFYLLWGLVGIRLLCPFTIESKFSLLPHQDTVQDMIVTEMEEYPSAFIEKQSFFHTLFVTETETMNADERVWKDGGKKQETVTEINKGQILADNSEISTDTGYVDTTLAQSISATNSIQANSDRSTSQLSDLENEEDANLQKQSILAETNFIKVLSCIWLVGMVVIFTYTLLSFLKLRRKVAVSIHEEENVWICDEISSPFILGIVRPRIYMPSSIAREQKADILAHEMEHLKYHDNVWKPLGMMILAIHWFHPLVWLSYHLFCRDIEFACDERVIRKMNNQEKKHYMESLLLCSSSIRFHSPYSVAFGETNIRSRIKNVLHYKKPTVWIFIMGIFLGVVVTMCFMTNPKGNETVVNGTQDTEQRTEETTEGNLSIEPFAFIETYQPNLPSEKADLNHDGMDDFIKVVTSSYNYEAIQKNERSCDTFSVQVFLGKESGWEKESLIHDLGTDSGFHPVWELSLGAEWNGCYMLTEKDGKDYLIRFGIDKYEGKERYLCEIIDVREDRSVRKKKEVLVEFANDPFSENWEIYPHREEVIPAFREEVEPWFENAKLLISCRGDELYIPSQETTFSDTKAYLEEIWGENESKLLAEYEALPGTARWEKVIYRNAENPKECISWIKDVAQSDFSKWFSDHNGEKKQIIFQTESNPHAMAIYDDIVYRSAGLLKDTIAKMVNDLVDDKSKKWYNSDGTYFELWGFGIGEHSVIPITENMWLLPYFNLYYNYEGIHEGVSFEERVEAVGDEMIIGNMIPILRSKEAEEYYYIVIEYDGMYRLERMKKMMEKD